MKKIIVAIVAGLFLVGGAAVAGDYSQPAASAQWQGNQNQNYSSYNFQGTTASNTTTFTKGTDLTFTNYNQQNCNYNQHTNDIATSNTFSVNNVVTAGNLQNQGLSMAQTGNQDSQATPAYGVSGSLGFTPIVSVLGAGGAGANGSQAQVITASNAQMNGNINLTVGQDLTNTFTANKDWGTASVGDINKAFAATGTSDNSGWGVGGVVLGGALALGNPSWGVAGLIGGFAYDKDNSFATTAANAANWNIANAGYSNLVASDAEHYDLSVQGHIDYQNQTGSGTAGQTSNTCAGLGCYQGN